MLNGIVGSLRSGTRWKAVPARFPSYQPCQRRFPQWVTDGLLSEVLRPLAEARRWRGRSDITAGFIDGTCAGAKKRGLAGADRAGLPRAVRGGAAAPHEVPLVEATLAARFIPALPLRLLGDRAYDSAPLDASLAAQHIDMLAPHERTRRNPKSQDGRALRRDRRRWKGERLFAWLQHCRRLSTRHEYRLDNYLGFVQLACSLILLRQPF